MGLNSDLRAVTAQLEASTSVGGNAVYQDYRLFTTVASPHKFRGYDGGE